MFFQRTWWIYHRRVLNHQNGICIYLKSLHWNKATEIWPHGEHKVICCFESVSTLLMTDMIFGYISTSISAGSNVDSTHWDPAIHMHQWTRLILIQVMAGYLLGTKPSLWFVVNWTNGNNIKWTYETFSNVFQNVFCKMSAFCSGFNGWNYMQYVIAQMGMCSQKNSPIYWNTSIIKSTAFSIFEAVKVISVTASRASGDD